MIHYKTVAGPIGLTIEKKGAYQDAVRQYGAIIQREAVGGWKLDFIQEIPVTKKAGCLGSLLGRGDITITFNMLVFSKED